jgi:hypothetical protein
MTSATFARATFAAAAARPTMNDDLRREIAEQLLLGTPPQRIIERLTSRGLAGGVAEAEVARAAKSPYLLGAERLQARLAKRDWLLANQARLGRLRDGEAVPRLPRLSGETFFADFYTANRPVLVTGLVDHWPAMARWTLPGLRNWLGHVEIDVQWQREANAAYEMEAHKHVARQPMGGIIDRILTGGPSNDFYVTAFNSGHNNSALAPLWDDIAEIPGWLAPGQAREGFFWMGPQGTITPFHHDLTNNLMVQIVGEKRVKLVDASETPRMRNDRHCFSAWHGADLPAGPGDADRPPVAEVVLRPGDALFLPIGWWHHVEALTPTIGMSFTNFARDNDFYSHYSSYGAV